MSKETTFRQIEKLQEIQLSSAELDSSLGYWYDSVRDKEMHDFSVVTLSAFRPKRLCGNLLGRSHHHGEHHGRS